MPATKPRRSVSHSLMVDQHILSLHVANEY
jgi:hypothetical protein